MERIDIRELGQCTGDWWGRVRSGESFEITDGDVTVARLIPGPPDRLPEGMLGDLIREGRAIPALARLEDHLPPPKAVQGRPTLSDTLIEMREQEY
ncbi:MAG: hypothetical protein NVS9B15_25430 [Acidobacteriaceae bacterium]